jgi:hypothetical protein
MTLRLSAFLCSIAAFVAGWYLGRDHEWRLWQEACETPLPEPETTNVDPVTMTLSEFVGLVTRDFPTDLKHEWEFNR